MEKRVKIVAIYVRVSTDEQTTENQELQLKDYCERMNWDIYKIYKDEGVSGSKTSRPSLDLMMEGVHKKKFDAVLVWKLDRVGRSLQHLLSFISLLREKNIEFISYTDNFDTSTPNGKLQFSMIGAFAEFERDLIIERTKAGLQRAKAKGVKLGKPKASPQLTKKIITLYGEGKSYRQIQEEVVYYDKNRNPHTPSLGLISKIIKYTRCSQN